MTNSVQRIPAEEYGARVVVSSRDEIGMPGSAFNKMAADSSISYARLVEHRQTLEQHIDERTWELERSNISQEKEAHAHQAAAERAEYLAFCDGLIDLPNRGMFSKLLNQSLSQARRAGQGSRWRSC